MWRSSGSVAGAAGAAGAAAAAAAAFLAYRPASPFRRSSACGRRPLPRERVVVFKLALLMFVKY